MPKHVEPAKGPIERLDAIEAQLADMKAVQPTPQQPHVTVEAPRADWGVILADIAMGINVFGPFIVHLIESSQTNVTYHQDGSIVSSKP